MLSAQCLLFGDNFSAGQMSSLLWNLKLFITVFRKACDLSHCQVSPHLHNCLEIIFNIIL